MQDMPLQPDKMREALMVIAEVRDSERLRQFIESGRDRKSFLQFSSHSFEFVMTSWRNHHSH